MNNVKKQIKWKVIGSNGWDRKGDYHGYEVMIEWSFSRNSYEIRFGTLRHGSYTITELEVAKEEAERLMPGWVADRQAAVQAREEAARQQAAVNLAKEQRSKAVVARLAALGVPAFDLMGSVALRVDIAESIAAALENSGASIAIETQDNVAA